MFKAERSVSESSPRGENESKGGERGHGLYDKCLGARMGQMTREQGQDQRSASGPSSPVLNIAGLARYRQALGHLLFPKTSRTAPISYTLTF